MKNFLKKWLGISEIEDVLIDPQSDGKYIGSEIDRKLDKEFLEVCDGCGGLFLKEGLSSVAKKDVWTSSATRKTTETPILVYYCGKCKKK